MSTSAMFHLANRRLALTRELESMKQVDTRYLNILPRLDFNRCSLPIEFVYRVIVGCVDEIMERGLNHRFILQNQYSTSVVASMLTLMADPDRRNLFSLKCMRIDTVVGVMLSALKNIHEPIVPLKIQEELTSASGIFLPTISTPTTPAIASSSAHLQRSPSTGQFQELHQDSAPRINTVASLLNHPNFPAVNRALLMELLSLSLAILNSSTFNCSRPDVLAGVLGPLIFATQHATILQHTPQQAYSFGWGVSLVSDIQRCSKMFYVVLGGYRREVLGLDDFDYDQSLYADAAAAMSTGDSQSSSAHPLSRGASRGGYSGSTSGDISSWIGSTSKASMLGGVGSTSSNVANGMGAGMATTTSGGVNPSRLHISTDLLVRPFGSNGLRPEFGRLGRYGGIRDISTTFTESVRAAATQEARQMGLDRSSSGSKGRAALVHLREDDQSGGGGGGDESSRSLTDTTKDVQPELFRARLRSTNRSALLYETASGSSSQEQQLLRPSVQKQEDNDDRSGSMSVYERQKEERRQEIENMIRGCRGIGFNFTLRNSDSHGEAVGMAL